LCQLGVNGSCGAGVIAGRGFVNYNASANETISLWMICLDPVDWNTTLSITALFQMNISTMQPVLSSDNSLSGGGIAGIVIACVVVFFSLLAIYFITKKGPVSMREALIRCCKNKTQSVPTESPRV
jgi:hypothetical protein